jgi:hypothetical protein
VYHFLFTGFDDRGLATVIGAFGVDASGNVSGEEEFLDPGGSVGGQIVGGQCTNSSTPNQGTLTTVIPETFSTETLTYTFVLQQGGSGAPRGQLVEPGDMTAIRGSISGSGVFVQVPPDVSLSGDYAFGMAGTDPSGGRMSEVGRFNVTNGNVSAGVADINDAGTVTANAQVSGTFLQALDAYSRAVATLTIGGQPHSLDIFVNSSGGGFAIDDASTVGFARLAGIISSQANAGAYSNGDLNAPFIFSAWGVVPGPPASSDSTVGLASGFNSGAGTFNLLFDKVSGGVANLNQSATASYSVAANGRATVSYTLGGNTVDYVFYLDNLNDGFILGTSGNTAEFGFFQPQAPGPFTTATINGTFASATFLQMTPTSPNLATEITLNNGTLSANTPAGALTGTYAVAPSGRGTASVNLPVLGGRNLVLYVIGPGSVEVMGSDNTMSDAIAFMHF